MSDDSKKYLNMSKLIEKLKHDNEDGVLRTRVQQLLNLDVPSTICTVIFHVTWKMKMQMVVVETSRFITVLPERIPINISFNYYIVKAFDL